MSNITGPTQELFIDRYILGILAIEKQYTASLVLILVRHLCHALHGVIYLVERDLESYAHAPRYPR